MCYRRGTAFSASPQNNPVPYTSLLTENQSGNCSRAVTPVRCRRGRERRRAAAEQSRRRRGCVRQGVRGPPAAAALPGGPGSPASAALAPLSSPLPPPPPPAAADTPAGKEREENERGSRGCLGKGSCGVWTKPLCSTPTRPSPPGVGRWGRRYETTATRLEIRSSAGGAPCLSSTVGYR